MARTSRFLTILSLAVCLATLGFVKETQAGPTFSAKTTNSSLGVNVKISYGGSTSTVHASPFKTTVWNGSEPIHNNIFSYCVDLFQTLVSNQLPVGFTVESGIVDSAQGGGAKDRNIGAAAWLAQTFHSTADTKEKRAALQVAIWEVTYDWEISNPSNLINKSSFENLLDNGFFSLKNHNNKAAVQSQAAEYLISAWDSSTNGFKTASGHFVNYAPPGDKKYNQDQVLVTQVVPEPSTLAMGVLGMVACLGVGVQRRLARNRQA